MKIKNTTGRCPICRRRECDECEPVQEKAPVVYRYTATFRLCSPSNRVSKASRSCRDTSLESARERLLRRAAQDWPGFGVVMVCLVQTAIKGRKV